jgi:tetratricopeptide (TPR) repeat protein
MCVLWAVLVLTSIAGCGASQARLHDRDRGLDDRPISKHVAREPLQGQLLSAMRLLQNGQHEDAQKAFLAHLGKHQDSALSHYHLGLIAMDADEFETARRHLSEAARIEPHLFGAAGNLGVLYLRSGESLAALRILRKAVAKVPKEARLRNNLANALMARGHWSAAVTNYRAAIRLAPGHATILYNTALALHQRHLDHEALKLLDETLMYRPGFALARALRVSCLLAMGHTAEAVTAARHSLQLLAETAELYVALGHALIASGARSEGIEALQDAVDLDHSSSLVLLAHGEALDDAGAKTAAVQAYQRYMQLKTRRPDDTRRIRRRLKHLKDR